MTPADISSVPIKSIIDITNGNINEFNPEKIESEFAYITYGLYNNTLKNDIHDSLKKTIETQLNLKNNIITIIGEKEITNDDQNIYYLDYKDSQFNLRGRVFVLMNIVDVGNDKKVEMRYIIHYIAKEESFSFEKQSLFTDSFKLDYIDSYLRRLENDYSDFKNNLNKSNGIVEEMDAKLEKIKEENSQTSEVFSETTDAIKGENLIIIPSIDVNLKGIDAVEKIIDLSKQAKIHVGNKQFLDSVFNQMMLLVSNLENEFATNQEILSKVKGLKLAIVTADSSSSSLNFYLSDIERMAGFLIEIIK